MKKKIIPYISFILILSFILPFFPCFSISAFADDSVSDDSAYEEWYRKNTDTIRNSLANNGVVVNPDYYLVDPDNVNPNLWDVIARFYGVGVSAGKPLARSVYDYSVSNNLTVTDIYNDCFNTVYNDVLSFCPYNICTVLHKSDLRSLVYSQTNDSALWVSKFNIENLDSDSIYFAYVPNNYLLNGNSNYSNPLELISIPLDFFDNYSFYCLTNNFSSDYFYSDNFVYDVPITQNDMSKPVFTFWCVSGNSVPSSLTFYQRTYYVWAGQPNSPQSVSRSYFAYLPLYKYCSTNRVNNYIYGGFFIAPDSVDTFSFPIFRSYSDYFGFDSGDSFVYQFDPSLDISQYGDDLNLDDLYDVISNSVDDAQGNIINAINDVANDYLKKQIKILGDIKNALNDSFGNSWLRLIHDQLDIYFPKTLDALDDLAEAVSNLSFSGGGSSPDLSALDNIDDNVAFIKGLMLLNTAHDIIDDLADDNVSSNDFSDVLTVANTKFPFSIPNDIITVLGLFVASPREPSFELPVPFSASGNTFEIDISFIDSMLPLIHGIFIILFLVFLVSVSIKVVNSLKE